MTLLEALVEEEQKKEEFMHTSSSYNQKPQAFDGAWHGGSQGFKSNQLLHDFHVIAVVPLLEALVVQCAWHGGLWKKKKNLCACH